MRLSFLLWVVAGVVGRGAPVTVESPGGAVTAKLDVVSGKVQYTVSFEGKEVIRESALGLVLGGAARLDGSFRMDAVRRGGRSESWRPLYGERNEIPDRFRSMEVDLVETIAPRRRLTVEVRAYEEGLAFRYVLPAQPALGTLSIAGESTEFRLPEGAFVWETPEAQSTYRRTRIAEMKGNSERPLLVELPNGVWAAIAEAGVEDYATMFLSLRGEEQKTLGVALGGAVRGKTPFSSPWRVILIGRRPGDLLEHNYLLLNLSPLSRLSKQDWIRPGKVLREVTLSTRGGREAVDFAARHGLQYIEYDAGWYGFENDEESDATRVSIDPRRLRKEPEYQGLDLPAVIGYARSKGIGVWLYVNRRAIQRQRETILPLFAKWGVAGVKYGFVNVHTQEWTKWLYDSVKMAADNRLMVDIHDEFRPTGMSRAYPNLLTQEGILGNEGFPDAAHSTILPFTRMLAGAADYTYCWLDARLKNSWAHQLGLSVALYSPLQFVYWYDCPATFEQESPAMEFLDRVPVTWDETRVLDGTAGEYVVVARRAGSDWYVGVVGNQEARRLRVPLAFLPREGQYEAKVFADGNGVRDVRIRTENADVRSVLSFELQPRGGAAVMLRRKSK